jgi:hypothetical protein
LIRPAAGRVGTGAMHYFWRSPDKKSDTSKCCMFQEY